MRLILLALALAAPSAACQGQSAAPASDASSRDALELAMAMDLSPPLILHGMISDPETIERELLSTHYAPKGAPCDAQLPACLEAARAVAAEVAPQRVAHLKMLTSQFYTRLFERSMTEQQIAQSLRAMKTPEGQALAAALRAASMSPETIKTNMAVLEDVSQKFPFEGSNAVEEFYQRTAGLPRRQVQVAPPPPLPPR